MATILPRRYRTPLPTHKHQSGFSTALAAEGVLLVMSIVLAWILSATFISPTWSLVATANFLWMFTWFFRVEPRVTVLELPQFITRASSVVALIFIEFGSDIPELGMTGSPGPYSSAYIFYLFLLFGTATAAFRLVAGPPGRMQPSGLVTLYDRYANALGVAAVACVGLIICWLFVRGLVTGFPLIKGVDRFLYRRLMGDKITILALTYKYVLLFILGMVAFQMPVVRKLKAAALLVALISMLVFFLFADKFFTQLVAIAGLLAPYLYVNHERVRRNLLTFTLILVAALSMVFSVTWYIYSSGGTESTAVTTQKLNGRMVGQGELWFLQARIGSPMLNYNESFVQNNIDILEVKDADLYAIQHSIGPNFFSNRYAPDNIRASLLKNKGTVSYTAALEPLGLMSFGWVGLALMEIFFGLLITASTTYLAYTIVNRSVISGAFAAYVWIQFRYILAQGAPWVVFGIYPVKWLFVIGLLEVGLYTFGLSQRRKDYHRDMRLHNSKDRGHQGR